MRSLQLLGDPPRPAIASRFPFLAKGFRPFFLAGAIFGAVMVPLWVLSLFGVVHAGGRFDPVTWHAHEMVFGFGTAIVAGFLLTAVGNWTGRETAAGTTLLLLFGSWLAGRVVMSAGGALPPWVVAAIDVSFLPAAALAIGRPIVAAKDRRHFLVIAMLVFMAAANLFLHLRPAPDARRALLAGTDAITFFMVVIAGRVVPPFTRNATGVASIRAVPILEVAAAVSILPVIFVDAAGTTSSLGRFMAYGGAASLVAARTVHWGTRHTRREPLLWILHAGHAWIPIGLGLRAASAIAPAIPASLGVHAITAGAVGALTIGMMARVALGHTGRSLVAPRSVALAFVLVTVAAVVRVAVPLVAPALYLASLAASAVLWSVSFLLYAGAYAPILLAARADGKAG